MEGVTLIGMAGAGKSTIGKKLAGELNYSFIDLDHVITERQGMSYHEVLKRLGDQKFLEIENEYTLDLDLHDSVFAPGGSIVYCPGAMEKIREETHVAYLSVSIETIRNRLKNALEQRGIVGMPAKSLEEIYAERSNLYSQYANSTIDAESFTEAEIIELVKTTVRSSA
jgi:shikimate kinase